MRSMIVTVVLLLAFPALAGDYTLAPDGTYVAGYDYTLAPDGTYVAGGDYTLGDVPFTVNLLEI